MNITELKELAEKATGGELVVGSSPFDQSRHVYCKSPVTDGEESWLPLIASTDDGETLVDHEANAAFIAAANPAEILELIAKLEDYRAQMERQKDEWLSWEAKRRDLEKAAAQLDDAQGGIRALRATEQNLRERVKALEEGLKSCHGSLKFLGDASDGDVSPKAWRKSGAEASELQALNLLLQNRALLEQKP